MHARAEVTLNDSPLAGQVTSVIGRSPMKRSLMTPVGFLLELPFVTYHSSGEAANKSTFSYQLWSRIYFHIMWGVWQDRVLVPSPPSHNTIILTLETGGTLPTLPGSDCRQVKSCSPKTCSRLNPFCFMGSKMGRVKTNQFPSGMTNMSSLFYAIKLPRGSCPHWEGHSWPYPVWRVKSGFHLFQL